MTPPPLRDWGAPARAWALGLLACLLAGLGVALAMVQMSSTFTPAGLGARFAGPETDSISPHTVLSLLQTTHTHLFTLAFLQALLGGLFLLSGAPRRLRGALAGGTFALVLADHAAMWTVKLAGAAWSPLLLLSGGALSAALLLQWAWCAADLLRPRLQPPSFQPATRPRSRRRQPASPPRTSTKEHPMRKITLAALALAALAALAAAPARADERLFGFSYEADLLPKGGLEYEQTVTDYNGQAQGIFNRWQIAQELEYGFSDRLSGSLYLNFNDEYSSVVDPSGGVQTSESFSFDGLSSEWKYQVLSPLRDALGLVLYLEPRFSGTELEIEPKLILQKNLGDAWTLAVNVAEETEYGFAADGQTMHGEEAYSAGLAWKSGPFAAGAELLNKRLRPEWGDETASAWFLGPCVHYAADKWWATLSVLPQVQGQSVSGASGGLSFVNDDYAKVESRLILGIEF